jgi:hypothetical protein
VLTSLGGSVGGDTELFFEQGKGGAHDLAHVMVTVLGKTPGKIDIGFDRHQCRRTLDKELHSPARVLGNKDRHRIRDSH